MAYTIPTPPTFASPVIVNPQTGQNQFNPIWLQWFLVLAQSISTVAEGRIRDIVPVVDTGIYNPSSGTNNLFVFLWGGGGMGGLGEAPSAGQVSAGGGGGAGGFTFQLMTSGFSGQTLTVGGPGGDTSFAGIVAHGGSPGSDGIAGSTPAFVQGGVGGGSSGGLINGYGGAGSPGIVLSGSAALGGAGANSTFGQGGLAQAVPGANPALGYGAGGSGGRSTPGGAAQPGGAGAPGVAALMELS